MTMKTMLATTTLGLMAAFAAQAQQLKIPATLINKFGDKPHMFQDREGRYDRLQITSADNTQWALLEFNDKNKDGRAGPGELHSVHMWLTNKDNVVTVYGTGGQSVANDRQARFTPVIKSTMALDKNGKYPTDAYGQYIMKHDPNASRDNILQECEMILFNTYSRVPLPGLEPEPHQDVKRRGDVQRSGSTRSLGVQSIKP